jgi:hypothetical protein
MKRRIIGLMDFVYVRVIFKLENLPFRKRISFPSTGQGKGTATLLGSLESINFQTLF